MKKEFSIYKSPLSEETKKIRRNSLLVSGLCLFIGLTGNLPDKIALLGLTFSPEQQNILGWFIFVFSLYLFLHFVSSAGIEVANWVQPFITDYKIKKSLIKCEAFDNSNFIDHEPPDENENPDDTEVRELIDRVERGIDGKFQHIRKLIWLKLTIEILAPFLIGVVGLFYMFQMLTKC